MGPKVAAMRLLQFQLKVTDMEKPDVVNGADSFPACINVWIES